MFGVMLLCGKCIFQTCIQQATGRIKQRIHTVTMKSFVNSTWGESYRKSEGEGGGAKALGEEGGYDTGEEG